MKKRIRVLFILFMVLALSGCSFNKSTAEKLAGTYYMEGNEDCKIIIYEPENDSSGKTEYYRDIDEGYTGTYEIYENSQKIECTYTDYGYHKEILDFTYDLDEETLTIEYNDDIGVFIKE